MREQGLSRANSIRKGNKPLSASKVACIASCLYCSFAFLALCLFCLLLVLTLAFLASLPLSLQTKQPPAYCRRPPVGCLLVRLERFPVSRISNSSKIPFPQRKVPASSQGRVGSSPAIVRLVIMEKDLSGANLRGTYLSSSTMDEENFLVALRDHSFEKGFTSYD